MTTEQANAREELRALVKNSNSELVRTVADQVQAMSVREAALASNMASLLTRSGPAWLKGAEPGEIMAFTRAATFLGLNPIIGECYLIHGGFYTSLAGRRKLAQRTGRWDGEDPPTMLTAAEEQVHGVKPGDIARRVQLWAKGVSRPAVGIGIVRSQEIEANSQKRGADGLPFHPLGRIPEYMAVKRATSAAYKAAFADLDVAVADLEQRGLRGYSVQIIDAALGEQYIEVDAPEPLPQLEAPPAVDPFTGEILEQQPDDERVGASEPTLAERTAADMQAILGTDVDADVVVGGVAAWLAMYPDAPGVLAAIAIAEAVHADLNSGAPSPSAAVDKVHRQRAAAGLPFNADVMFGPSEQADEPADSGGPPARKSARANTAPLGL